jgi:4'-phosphopantetheinyl transferase
VQFVYGLHGKPCLREDTGPAAIRFNLAHSHQLAVYVIARTREVGIDLEYMRPVPDLQQIATSAFSAREVAMLSGLPPGQQREAFYLCWTSKEAYVKAKGLGVAQPLTQFDVSLVPGKPARLLRVEGDPEETTRWSLRWLRPAPGYVAALAVEGHDWQLTCHDAR